MAQFAPCVGIDVSKARLDVAIFPDGHGFAVDNTPAGWAELGRRCADLAVATIGLEASGGYEQGVARALQEQGFTVNEVKQTGKSNKPRRNFTHLGIPKHWNLREMTRGNSCSRAERHWSRSASLDFEVQSLPS